MGVMARDFPALGARDLETIWSLPDASSTDFKKTWQDCTQDALTYCGIAHPPVVAAQLKNVGPCKIVLTGLESAGKRTLMKKHVSLYGGRDMVWALSSLKLRVEKLQLHAAVFASFNADETCDGPCCGHLLRVLEGYIRQCTALIWAVDACDRDKLSESLKLLRFYISDEGFPPNAPVLILANNQLDPKGPITTEKLHDEVRQVCGPYLDNRPWHITATDFISGLGVKEAFIWLSYMLKSKEAYAEAERKRSEKDGHGT